MDKIKCIIGASILLLVSGQVNAALYIWEPFDGSGGSGFFDLKPDSIGATDTNFTSATVDDFSFIFENSLLPDITYDDIEARELIRAIDGVLVDMTHFGSLSAYPDGVLVFAAGSADFKNSLVIPDEIYSGRWVIQTSGSAQIPEPSILALMFTGLIGLGIARRRVRG